MQGGSLASTLRHADSPAGHSKQPSERRGCSCSESGMTPGEGPGSAARPPESLRPSHVLLQPYSTDVVRQLPGGSWLGP